jgi:chemotaxis protein methyltransferase CheR
MTPADIELLVALCRSRAGLRVDPAKPYLIDSRLAPLARREGYGSIGDMIKAMRASREERLIWAVVEAMTLNETAFFRDREPFDQFAQDILPTLARLRGGAPIRVWSAGCATGQEAYSLAMLVDEARGQLGAARIELFGSDLAEACLEKAQSGLYTQFEVQRGLPIKLLVQHFEKAEEMWALTPRIRQMVRWRRINLIADITKLGQFDVIFCRNVLSSFDEAVRKRVLENIAALLPGDGYLVLGVRESAADVTEAFKPVSGKPGLFARNPAFRVAA